MIWLGLGGSLTTRLSLVSKIYAPNHHTSSPHTSSPHASSPHASNPYASSPHASKPHASKIQSTNPCVSMVQSTNPCVSRVQSTDPYVSKVPSINPILAWTNCALKARPIHAPKLLTVRAAINSRQGIPREQEDKVRTDAYLVSSSTHSSDYSGSLHAHTPAAISSRKRALNVDEAKREADRGF